MKRIVFYLGCFVSMAAMWSCNHDEPRYLDLNTGQHVDLYTDSTTGYMVNKETRQPVEVYVDTKSHDTIYGRTGKVVNGRVIKTDDGKWVVKGEGDEYKATSGDAKIKEEGDESKVKDGSYTKKVEKDGDVKIEDGNKTIKIDGKTGERKVKKDHNITDKVKKVFN